MTKPKVRWAEDGSTGAVADHVERVAKASDAPMIAVPGGSTPVAIFDELAARGLDWTGARLMLGDDRLVAKDHPASNQAKLESAFAQTAAIIEPLAEGMAVPELDLLWVGMGADGHIASLFPEMICDDHAGASVIRTEPHPLPPEAPFPRLSMNMEALTTAPKDTIIVIRGEDKKAVIEDALRGDSDLPIARLLRHSRAPVTIYWSPA
ncbi:6-phosphogluconolactonase [Citromicrobium bathyomarinum]|uniref:6-phosphogluconolactonase n=1 Tax=Citromicrobium bathyomarinum TaxID=72174 RepID=UPI003159E671